MYSPLDATIIKIKNQNGMAIRYFTCLKEKLPLPSKNKSFNDSHVLVHTQTIYVGNQAFCVIFPLYLTMACMCIYTTITGFPWHADTSRRQTNHLEGHPRTPQSKHPQLAQKLFQRLHPERAQSVLVRIRSASTSLSRHQVHVETDSVV